MRQATIRSVVLLAAIWCLAAAGWAAAARARGISSISNEASDNWAGYAVTARKPFRRVVGAWVQPQVSCKSAPPGYSAFWVGLGGFTKSSHGLEQIGTEADCTRGGASYYAWYELVPAPEVTLRMRVHAGDHMTASVTVGAGAVALHLHDLSNGKSFGRTIRMRAPDTSSAEWIAEAPSQCGGSTNRCQTLPLADFTQVTFSGATAATRGAPMSPIDSSSFSATRVTLKGGGGREIGVPGQAIASASGTQAVPGELTDSGSAFSVDWEEGAIAPPEPPFFARARP